MDASSNQEGSCVAGVEPADLFITQCSRNHTNDDDFASLYWIKLFSFRLAVINVCPVLVPSELLLSTRLPTSEG